MTPHRNTIESLLLCGCQKVFDPLPKDDDYVICRAHGRTQVVIRALNSWITNCTCGRVKYLGAAKLGAERDAAMHRQRARKGVHTVTIFDQNGELHRTFGASDQATLPLPERD